MYRIGLDIGIASVGWAVLETNSDGVPTKIIDLGSRVFDAAENPKTGASLAKPRRDARGARRRLRRHKFRLHRIKSRIVKYGILTRDALDHLYDEPGEDIYKIRAEALDRALNNKEFARLLIHLAQRRGFKSNRRVDAKDPEAGKLLTAVKDNTELMEEHGYRTVGEMLYKDPKFSEGKRNKEESYTNTVSRSQMEDEVKCIFEAQRKHGNQKASEEFEKEYLDIYLSQRSFEEGPGGNAGDYAPYSGNQIEKMVGHCTFEPDEKRAVKASYTFERANLLQNINKIRIIDKDGVVSFLNEEQRRILVEKAHKTESLDYFKIRKALELPETSRFANINFNRDCSMKEAEKKEKFEYLKHFHELRKALDSVEKNLIQKCPVYIRDEIGTILTYYKTDTKIREALDKVDDPFLTEEVKDAIMKMPNCTEVGSLSLKALKNIMPFLEDGKVYSEAVEAAGYNFRGHDHSEKGTYLPPLSEDDDIRNPVVRRAVSQTIKVVNAIVGKYGSPVAINIELARETARTFEDRQKILKQQEKNRKENNKTKEDLNKEFKIQASYMDILKDRLFKEQDGVCLYSGEKIDRTRLFEDGYVQIDHIVPYSISWDDSYSNKALVMTRENQQKGNRLPLEYLEGKKRDEFSVRVERQIRDLRKRNNLLLNSIPPEIRESFKDRNLNDTKYICRFMLNYLNDHLEFDQAVNKKKRVTALNGSVTAYLRKRWGLNKVRGDGDKHHALDAVVIGCVNHSLITRVTNYFKHKENFIFEPGQHGREKKEVPSPWPHFREEVKFRMADDPQKYYREEISGKVSLTSYDEEELEQVKPIFVSRMKVKKKTGPANDATIRGLEVSENGQKIAISKVPLSRLKLNKDGEIENYYHPEDDRLLYEALKKRLKEHGGKGEKAFNEPFYKPKANGERGPLVKKVKIAEKITSGVVLNHGEGIADNGRMLRTDFFRKKEGKHWKYYAVPIYVKDMVNGKLPDRAVTQKKTYDQWDRMSDDDFIFSLYPNDVVYIEFNKPKKGNVVNKESTLDKTKNFTRITGYYKALGIATNSITVITDDNSYKLESIGIKTLPKIEKCSVDVLGKYAIVPHESRRRG